MAIPSAIGNNISQTSGNSICHNILAITSAKQVVIPSATILKINPSCQNIGVPTATWQLYTPTYTHIWLYHVPLAITSAKQVVIPSATILKINPSCQKIGVPTATWQLHQPNSGNSITHCGNNIYH